MTRAPREHSAYPLRRPRGADSHAAKALGRLCSCGTWRWGPDSLLPSCTHEAKPEPPPVSRQKHARQPRPSG